MKSQEKTSLIASAYTVIRDMILNFELAPEQVISDFTLANSLNMSRTPVREAIAMLRRDGLIELVENKHIAAAIDKEQIKDLYIAREAVECRSVELLIEEGFATEALIKKLREYNQRIEHYTESNDILLTFEPDACIHSTIVEHTGSQRLKEQMGFYLLQNERLRFLTLVCNGRARSVPEEHTTIINALEQRNVAKAIEAIRWHLRYTTDTYIEAIERFPANEWIPIIKAIGVNR